MEAPVSDEQKDKDRVDHVLNWYGFGSPVGLGILAVSLALAVLLLRFAATGFPG